IENDRFRSRIRRPGRGYEPAGGDVGRLDHAHRRSYQRMPAASLWLMPSLQAATDYMKEVVRPMLEASPTLLAKTPPQRPPNYRRILFEGGYCVFSGGASAINLASRAIRVLLCDEIDKLRDAPKAEGDPLSLILKRLSTYVDSKALFASTPTVSGGSRI